MKRIARAVALLVGSVCLAMWAVDASAQGGLWERFNAAGAKAYQQADYAEAEGQFAAALGEAEGFFPRYPRLAASLDNLAAVYRARGKHAGAEPLYERSLAITEKALGPEHPRVAMSLDNLATLYDAEGNDAAAEPLLQRSLAIVERSLGPDYPNVAALLENYAALLRETGRDAEAENIAARNQETRAQHAKELY